MQGCIFLKVKSSQDGNQEGEGQDVRLKARKWV